MIVFDTDHFNVLAVPGVRADRLNDRMAKSVDQNFAVTIVSVEEQMRGWLSQIHRQQSISNQLKPYSRLGGLISFWNIWQILPFDEAAAVLFQSLRRQVRVGTQDLKIAAIALERGAKLVTGNTIDFERVPGLEIEDWLD